MGSKYPIVVNGTEVKTNRRVAAQNPKVPSKAEPVSEPKTSVEKADKPDPFDCLAPGVNPFANDAKPVVSGDDGRHFEKRLDTLVDEGSRFAEVLRRQEAQRGPRPKEPGVKQVEHDVVGAFNIFKDWLVGD